MLVKTILRRTLGIKNHVVTKVEWAGDRIRIHLDVRKRRRLPCVSCGTLGRLRDRLKERRWKHVPRWGIPVTRVYLAVA